MVVSYGYPQAQITGLEGSLPIWLTTSHGLAHYIHSEDSVTNALRRIKVNHDTFEHYLPNLPDNSIDIIYFDPMFEVPVEESPQFKPLRGHTVESHIDDKIMEELCVLPRMVLLLKNDPFSSVFQNYPPHQWVGGKYSRIGYGVYMEGVNVNPLITIVGPTAVGKTDLTLDLAEQLHAEVISGDAYQVYKQLNIGTAKPSADELKRVKHHLIDILEPK